MDQAKIEHIKKRLAELDAEADTLIKRVRKKNRDVFFKTQDDLRERYKKQEASKRATK